MKKTNKTFVIGDIHGGLKALIQVIEKAKITINDTLIFLGDYVDGWSESPQVIDYLIKLNKTYNCVFLKGNHDELLLDWLEGNFEDFNESMWYLHGGEATVNAYKTVNNSKKKEHITFLKSLQNYYLDDKKRLFVHAGFTNQKGILHEYFPKLFYWDRTLWEMVLALDNKINKESVFYPSRLKVYNEIYIGHTPTTRVNETLPMNRANVWNIDTGAGFYGPLTLLDADTKEFWQSDNLPILYPNEKGRTV